MSIPDRTMIFFVFNRAGIVGPKDIFLSGTNSTEIFLLTLCSPLAARAFYVLHPTRMSEFPVVEFSSQ